VCVDNNDSVVEDTENKRSKNIRGRGMVAQQFGTPFIAWA